MERQKIWIDSYHINSFDVSPNSERKSRLTSILSYFEESAWRHAQNLGFGFYDASSNKNAWVMSRLRIDVFKYPTWGDDFKIKTWPLGVDKLFALRTANFLDDNNEIFASLTSSWLIIDIKSRRPQIPSHSPLLKDIELSEEQNNIPWPIKLKPSENYEYIFSYKTRYSDLDINGHINNARYVEWVCNAILNKEILSMEINFIHESMLNENVALYINEIEHHKYSILCKREDDGKDIFIAEIITKN